MLPALHVEKETETGRGRQCGTSGLQRALILAAQFRGRRWGRWPRYCPDPLPEAEDPPHKGKEASGEPRILQRPFRLTRPWSRALGTVPLLQRTESMAWSG